MFSARTTTKVSPTSVSSRYRELRSIDMTADSSNVQFLEAVCFTAALSDGRYFAVAG